MDTDGLKQNQQSLQQIRAASLIGKLVCITEPLFPIRVHPWKKDFPTAFCKRKKLFRPFALRHGTQFQFCRVNDDMLDAFAFPGVGDVNQAVARLDYGGVGEAARRG